MAFKVVDVNVDGMKKEGVKEKDDGDAKPSPIRGNPSFSVLLRLRPVNNNNNTSDFDIP
jgi:hypothetical protein